MNFFKKNGRPSDDERIVLQTIQWFIDEKGASESEIPDCYTYDDLMAVMKRLLERYGSDEGDQPEPAPEPFEPFEVEDQEPEPVEPEPGEPEELPGEPEPDIPAGAQSASSAEEFISDDYDPFSDEIIERSYTQGNASEPSADDPDGLELEEAKTPLGDLPPATKRRAAEQTADALLKGYAQFAPMPFKWLAKIPEGKVEKMSFNGELDLSLEVSEGVSFEDYMKQTNAQIDEIFEVDSDTLDDIREPLIEVLMEQELELTPTQRLTMAIISHLAQMFTVAIKLRQQNNRILSYQKHLTALHYGRAAA